MANYNQQYAQQQGWLKQLGSSIQRYQAGNVGPGFGGVENAARISLIQNQGAAAVRNAIQAERERAAGFGGGAQPTARASAIQRQLEGGIAALGGADTSNALISEQAQNFALGRQNALTNISNEERMTSEFNPLGYAGAASSAESSAFKQQHEINVENQQKAQAIAGLVEKGVTTAATFGAGGVANLGAGENFGEGVSDFFKGGMDALGGQNG